MLRFVSTSFEAWFYHYLKTKTKCPDSLTLKWFIFFLLERRPKKGQPVFVETILQFDAQPPGFQAKNNTSGRHSAIIKAFSGQTRQSAIQLLLHRCLCTSYIQSSANTSLAPNLTITLMSYLYNNV